MNAVHALLGDLRALADELDSAGGYRYADKVTRMMRRIAQIRPQRGMSAPLTVQKSDDAAKALKSNSGLTAPVFLGKVQFNNRTISNAVAIHGDSKGYVHTNDPKWGSIQPKSDQERWRQYVASQGWPADTQPLSCYGKQAGGAADYQGEIGIGVADGEGGKPSFTLEGE